MKLSGFIWEPMKQANLIKTNLIIIIIVEIEKNTKPFKIRWWV